ncbi:MAG: TMEM175 family protein, partial [Terriglobus sp.]
CDSLSPHKHLHSTRRHIPRMSLTHTLVGKDGFRLRGAEMSRVDGFSDVVFGFALTLIVASLEVPRTYEELHDVMLGFLPFAICFVFLMMVWLSHFRFFRRFGLQDIWTILINAALLFTVLFYVYPMKFLFTLVGSQWVKIHYDHPPLTDVMQVRELTTLYGFGFVAIYSLLTLLNWNAWRQRAVLQLNQLELVIVRSEIVDLAFVAFTGLLVMLAAHVLRPERAFAACYIFLLIGPWKFMTGSYFGKRIRKLQKSASLEQSPSSH